MLQGDTGVLQTLRLGTQLPVSELLKQLGKAPPLSVLSLCYGQKEFNCKEYLVQHADDLDFVQETLVAAGNSLEINPILNGLLAGFNRRRRHHRFKYGPHNMELDRLRFANTATDKDSDLFATEVIEGKKSPYSQKQNNR